MKKVVLLLILLCLYKLGLTQNANLDYKYALKVSNLTSNVEYSYTSDSQDQTKKTFQILHPTFSVQWATSQGNAHEVELTYFDLEKTDATADLLDSLSAGNHGTVDNVTSTRISLGYTYILNFNKSDDRRFVPALGFGLNPYFAQTKFDPVIATHFSHSEIYAGAQLVLAPRITYFIGSKFFVDIHIPICLSNIYYSSVENENPVIPIENRSESSFNMEIFPKIFAGRVGIGFKI